MNIAIIGCGYVGSAVSRYWSQTLELTVTATTTTPQRVESLEKIANRVVVVNGNDPEALKSVLQGQNTVLLSVASKGRDPQAYQLAYQKTAQTLATVLPQVPEVRHLIYTGSFGLYGDQNGVTVDESSPVFPADKNQQIIYKTEQLLLDLASENLKVCILRLGGIYGPGREIVKIFSRIFGTTQPGNGRYPTAWVHLDDIVGAIEFSRQHQLEGIYNLVDNSSLTRRELIDLMCEKYDLQNVTWDVSLPNNRPYNVRVSSQKIQEAGYQFIHPQTLV
ncbi:NAD-dependent epimerase/dehydratase family protein [Limnoraphis robusta]|uniref:NAD-dependent epimerase/dehydratase family protein n=1 Tax=Limnoraphis robusta TaxID=1118279 RepID=UPI002B21358B|nr:NAD-dependent epimerase/dehydratase family protein [Limnoraphis robusta]MEA5500330.1 NAD-dependent epimerase/dehydratase family protein [Limnoraphis robusta BA-68 BA1]